MENMEMAILLERVAPKLKQFCDDHFCALNIVNLEASGCGFDGA
jgi:hypothetical protein